MQAFTENLMRLSYGFISKKIHLQYLIGVKIGHLIVKERYLVDDHGKEDPSKKYETESQAGPELLPWILWKMFKLEWPEGNFSERSPFALVSPLSQDKLPNRQSLWHRQGTSSSCLGQPSRWLP